MRNSAITCTGAALLLAISAVADSDDHAFIQRLNTPTTLVSTVPANQDQNPYGIAVVPETQGTLVKGNILVSNFNDAANAQGTGSTIVQVTPGGAISLFAEIKEPLPGGCPGGVGLTTALAALRSGFVIVGSLPTTDGTAATAQAGCLIVLDSSGKPVATIEGNGINGPWDMTALDFDGLAVLFVTNVLNGTVRGGGNVVNEGTVLRLLLLTPQGGTPRVLGTATIGSGFGERTDAAALVIGPTGVGFGRDGRLYVADTLANRISAIPNALFRFDDGKTGTTISEGKALNQPLGLAIAPNGDILTVNSGDGNIVETEPEGEQIAVKAIDVSHSGNGAGTLFGLAIAPGGKGVYFVDDGNNTLNLLH